MSPDASHRLGAGASVAPVGDVNSDGYNDFVIGYDGGQIMHQSEGGLLLVYGHKGQRTKVSVSVADGARN
ncbi:integrin alpha, partial [Aerococcus urinae]